MRRVLLCIFSFLLCFALFGCSGEQTTTNQGEQPRTVEEQSAEMTGNALRLELSREIYYSGAEEQLDYTVYNPNGQIAYLSLVPVLERMENGQWQAVDMQDIGFCGTANEIESRYDSSVALWMFQALDVGSYRLGFMIETAQGEALEMLYSQSFTLVNNPIDMKVVSTQASGVKILLCNYTGEDFSFCSDYVLEYDDGAQWQQVLPEGEDDCIQAKTDYVLQVGQCFGVEIDWLARYGTLPEGQYRLTKNLMGTETAEMLALQTEFSLTH